ncbi:MAG: hypothetical protein A3F10_03595 [Coxiella sp. RIFCSPHIGHO2_12_FULL_42_15]|nr:MAG: hypothetical protein A3F10_03595 [Coxiella sp. RIFCSPHIGHO2_12_FULL_42_15]
MTHFKMAPRRYLFRLLTGFFFINALIASLVIFGYLPTFSDLTFVSGATTGSNIFAWIYFVLAFFAQVSLYECGCALICALAVVLFPSRTLTIGLASLLSAALLASLIGDAIAFRLYHMHYAGIGWQVYQAGAFSEVLPLGYKEQVAIYVSFAVSFALESLLALFLWKVFSRSAFKVARRYAMGLVLGSWVFVYLSFGLAIAAHVWPQGFRYAILRVGRVVPYMSEMYLDLFEICKPIRYLAINDQQVPVVLHDIVRPLEYPQKQLICKPPKRKLNIVIIGIDTWRFTSMNPTVSPNIYRFSQQAMQFKNHFSGGNCTQPGLFSFFYGLPPNYWRAFLREKKGPLLIRKLQAAGYHLGIFFSAPINFPRFDGTLLADVQHIPERITGKNSIARDKIITREFLNFLQKQHSKKPFFSFLFYDTLHNYCESARPPHNPFQPATKSCDRFSLNEETDPTPYLNLYNNKMLFVDAEIEKVLRALREKDFLKNTIIIITADHGEQMNDEGMGLWGHASAYDSYQLHVPLLIHWPGQAPQILQEQTTHYDVVPTLLQNVLACRNPLDEYSVGHNLLRHSNSDYFVAGSYGDYAIVMPQRVMRIYPDGDYKILDRNGRHASQENVNVNFLRKVLHDLRAYFKPLPG